MLCDWLLLTDNLASFALCLKRKNKGVAFEVGEGVVVSSSKNLTDIKFGDFKCGGGGDLSKNALSKGKFYWWGETLKSEGGRVIGRKDEMEKRMRERMEGRCKSYWPLMSKVFLLQSKNFWNFHSYVTRSCQIPNFNSFSFFLSFFLFFFLS